VEGPKGPLAGSAAQRRTLALIAVIAASGERGISREKLIGLLWPDSTDERARHVLAQTLYRLRQELGAAAIEGSTTLRVNSESLTVDFTEFEDAVARGELERAASLYAGPFLDGFYLAGAPEFEPWAEVERSRLASLYKEALQRLATDAERQGFHARATTWLRSLSTVDPLCW
jgi:serine/threonine-protein kinase